MDEIFKINQSDKPLYDKLIDYCDNRNTLLFDVPAHKMGRNFDNNHPFKNVFKYDVNSSKEVDMLNNPVSVIDDAETLAADLYGANKAYFLVNGSTSGVQIMILSVCSDNDKIILPRNIHKSATNALILSGAVPVYIHPDIEENTKIPMGVTFKEVKETIDANLDAKALLLVSPTYFGIVSDLKKSIDYAKSKGMYVIIDESHGSHFGLCENFPTNSIRLGADMSTISMHKTGGSLTQSSILLVNDSISLDKVRNTINISQTSSANYLLLGSLDLARHRLANNKDLLKDMYDLSIYAQEQINKIDNLSCITNSILNGDSAYQIDPSKLSIDVSKLGITGHKVYDLLKSDYNIQAELAETLVVLLIISFEDKKEHIDKLVEALKDISSKHSNNKPLVFESNYLVDIPKMVYSPRQAHYMNTEVIDIKDAVGRVSAVSLMVYPPGISLVSPGELITKDIIEQYTYLVKEENVTLGSKIEDNIIKLLVIKED